MTVFFCINRVLGTYVLGILSPPGYREIVEEYVQILKKIEHQYKAISQCERAPQYNFLSFSTCVSDDGD
jgi:hypothetical protein